MRLSEVHIFIGWKIILFYRKDPQNLFQDHFCLQTEKEKNAIFRTKSMVSPLWKICKNATI